MRFAHCEKVAKNMKRVKAAAAFTAICLLAGCAGKTVGKGEYLIEGCVKTIPDSSVINLLKSDGQMMSVIASDTVFGGRFEFRDTVSHGSSRLWLCSFSEGFPNQPCHLGEAWRKGLYLRR